MRIAIVANDTRGGVQPYLALGLGLRAAGHDVRVVAPSDFTSMFSEAGLPMAPLSGSVEATLRGSAGEGNRGAIASMRFVARELPRRMQAWTRETLEGCEGADIITGGVGGMVVGLAVAERLGTPFIETHLQPVGAPTAAYPGVLLPGTPSWLGGWGRRMSHHVSEAALWMPFRRAMTSSREQVLGLTGPTPGFAGRPALYGFSRYVLPALPQRDRPRHVTGYWTRATEASWRPPAGLDAFLARGGPVVSIGFGSMAADDPVAVTEMVLGAVREAGVRAVLLAGWGGLQTLADENVYCADMLPHDWLFPRVDAAVHHGGAGTTGAALQSGTPAIVVPFTMDQPFWGARVAALGVGPSPIPRRRLSQARLAEALARTLSDFGMRERASNLGARIRAENGVAEAVGQLERLSG